TARRPRGRRGASTERADRGVAVGPNGARAGGRPGCPPNEPDSIHPDSINAEEGRAMDLELSADQELFVETTRRFLEAECPITEVRRLHDAEVSFEPGYWRNGAELGWTAALVPEEHGGGSISGAGLIDLVLVAEEMGRLVSPGPL